MFDFFFDLLDTLVECLALATIVLVAGATLIVFALHILLNALRTYWEEH